MKQHIYKIFEKYKNPLFILSIIAVAFWFCAPYIFIEGQYPFQPLENRLCIIGLFYLGWILYLFAKPAQASLPLPKHPEALKKVQAQLARFQGAIQFLKKTQINKFGKSNFKLTHLPWYLLIGPSGTGKTSLLANANVNYILTKQFKQEKIVSSDACNWWVTRDIVLIDVPGMYLKDKEQFLWDHFLNLMKKNENTLTLNTVIVALPLPELMKSNSPLQKKLASDIKQKIIQLRERFGSRLNFYFIVTKCDYLPGFSEFFSESGTEELTQAWGITLPTSKENENVFDIFNSRFNALIKRLNSQLIWRLQQERNSNIRPAIKDFPLQVERLKESLNQFLKALAIPDLRIYGVYLTSALQSISDETSSQGHVINASTHQSLQLLRSPAMPSKPYFIRQLILAGLLSSADQPTSPIQKGIWKSRLAYAASILTIISAAILLGHDFQQSVFRTYAIQNNLAQFQIEIQQPGQQDAHLVKALPLLNALQVTAEQTKDSNNLMTFYSDKSQKTAKNVYQEALKTIVIPEIKNSFENYLKNYNDKNPVQLYAVLKAYLMLGNKQNFQIDYVVSVLQKLLPTTLNPSDNNDLIKHIHTAFDESPQPIEMNNDLVFQVRKHLISLQPLDLAFVILKNINNYDTTITINLGNLGNPVIFSSKKSINQIPTLFTDSVFSDVITQELPIAANEALQGNSVLGTAEVLSNEATINALTTQLRSRYISSYVDTWENVVANLKLTSPTNLNQTDEVIATLMGDTSPLLQLLKTIKQNTSFVPVLDASQKLRALNDLLTNAHNEQENTLYQIFVNLRQLHFYLQNILSANNVNEAAFNTARNRMQNPSADVITQVRLLAQQNPEPMKSWLNNLATQSWYYILQEAGQHIENAYQINILTIYHSQIANKDINNIDIQQLAGLIGKQGAVANFYFRYLKPFVNDNYRPWQWRMVDNQKLPFGNNFLAQLQDISKFQNVSKYVLYTQARQNPALQHLVFPEKLTEKA